MSSDERDTLRERLARCTTLLPSQECQAAAADLWRMQDLLRQELDAAAGELPAHHGRSRVADALHRYTPAQLLAALDGAQAEARDLGRLEYFNGVTNWRPDQIDRHIARAQSGARTENAARAAFEHMYRSVDPRWWTGLPVAERAQILGGLERAYGGEDPAVLTSALRHLADTATRAPSRAEIRAAIHARRVRETGADDLGGRRTDPAVAAMVGAALAASTTEPEHLECAECGGRAAIPSALADMLRRMDEPILCGTCTTWRLDPARAVQALIAKMPRHPGGRGRHPTTREIERCRQHGYQAQMNDAMRRAGWSSNRDESAA